MPGIQSIRSLVLTALLACALSACGGGIRGANVSPGPMPEGGNWQGRYHSVQYGEMRLCRTGSQVVGTYEKDERRGRIQGTLQGDVLRFQWSERRELVRGRPNLSEGRGYFQYSIEADGRHYLIGEWGHDENEVGGGPWRAYRLNLRANQRVRCDDLAPDTTDSGRLEFGATPSSAPPRQSAPPPSSDSGDGLLGDLD